MRNLESAPGSSRPRRRAGSSGADRGPASGDRWLGGGVAGGATPSTAAWARPRSSAFGCAARTGGGGKRLALAAGGGTSGARRSATNRLKNDAAVQRPFDAILTASRARRRCRRWRRAAATVTSASMRVSPLLTIADSAACVRSVAKARARASFRR